MPDAEVNGVRTEFKSLSGSSANTVKNALSSAKGQAADAILDARDSDLKEEAAQAGLERFLRFNPKRMQAIRIVGKEFEINWP
jgi:hypothetical protein